MPVFVLPNLRTMRPIEGKFIAIVDASDSRIADLETSQRRFGSFLNRFTDAFGVSSRPSVLLAKANAPKPCLDVGALASFRDIASVSTVAKGRAILQIYKSAQPIAWANTFDFHPWMIDKNYEYLVARTPALWALHEVKAFKGQCSPEVSRMDLKVSDVDTSLVTELVARWDAHYPSRGKKWADLALFRSLNMANQACLLPAATAATVYDFGRAVGLWISAFEILVHPGPSGKADIHKVFDLLDQAPWISSFPRRYAIGPKRKGTIASWLYRRMHNARNAFLHGNPVALRDLLLKPGGRGLLNFCAPLFRMALSSFLDLKWNEPPPHNISDIEIVSDWMIRRADFTADQQLIERALSQCREKPIN